MAQPGEYTYEVEQAEQRAAQLAAAAEEAAAPEVPEAPAGDSPEPEPGAAPAPVRAVPRRAAAAADPARETG